MSNSDSASQIEKGVVVTTGQDLLARVEALVAKQHLQISDSDLQYICDKIDSRSLEESRVIVEQALEEHQWDPNFDDTLRENLEELLKGHDIEGPHEDSELELKLAAAFIADWSPYLEVRAVTRMAEDDEEENCETFRVYVIGVGWGLCGAVLNTFFANRFPTVSITSSAMQIMIYLSGIAWSYIPDYGITIRGTRYSLSPGAWTFKEQMLATLGMSVSNGVPYAFYIITSQKSEYFYNFQWTDFGYCILITLSSQLMGFGIAGLVRSYLVYPVQCVWFSVLPNIKVNRTLVAPEVKERINGWTIRTFPFFWIVFWASFAYYWIPDFLFAGLSYFNWMTWIKPDNVNLAVITGGISGLGVNPIPTLDWNNMDFGGMYYPFFSTANAYLGQWIGFIAIIILWYTNSRWTGYIPINDNSLYANDGTVFDVSQVLDASGVFDAEKYQAYSPPYYSAGNLVVYGSFFMVYPAAFVYAILYYGKIMIISSKKFIHGMMHPMRTLENFDDPFSRRLRKYKEVPEWCFLVIFLGSVAMAIGVVEGWKDTQTPVWSIFFSIAINLVFLLPFGYLYATTALQFEVNVLIELIIGYALPGKGTASMITKTYATNFLVQTDNYITNQKQSHYCGIPPRALFRIQIISVILSSFVSVGILWWQLNGGVADMCSTDQPNKFTCANTRTFFSASVIWGVIGPKRVFDGLYPAMKYCFLIGALIPIPFYFAHRYGPRWVKEFNPIIIISGAINWAPYNFMYYTPNFYLAFIFNYFIRRRYASWWQKYNYLLYAALGAGLAWSVFIMFFATEYKHIAEVDWWGNNVPYEGMDYAYPVRETLAPGEIFGPPRGQLP